MAEPRRVLDEDRKQVWSGEGEDVALHVAQSLTQATGIEHVVSRPTEYVEATNFGQVEPAYLPVRWS